MIVLMLTLGSVFALSACESPTGDQGPDAGVDDLFGGDVDGESEVADAEKPTETDAVEIRDFKYKPDNISVASGTTVTVTNNDSTQHTFTAEGGDFDTGVIKPGESKTVTISGTSEQPFFCQIHNSMQGQAEVTS